ncbi:MAG: hypothetical protein ACLP1X_00370 [Polyangiaceae bacterium]
MSPTATKIVHYVVLAVTAVAGFAPYLPVLKGLLPGQAYAVIAAACAGALYLMQSPLFTPLLPVQTPEKQLAAAQARVAKGTP